MVASVRDAVENRIKLAVRDITIEHLTARIEREEKTVSAVKDITIEHLNARIEREEALRLQQLAREDMRLARDDNRLDRDEKRQDAMYAFMLSMNNKKE